MNTKTHLLLVFSLGLWLGFVDILVPQSRAQVVDLPVPASAAAVSFDSLLGQLGDRAAFARMPDPVFEIEFVKQNAAAAQGEGETGEWKVATFEGPGAIARIWSARPAGTIRVYFDGATEPTIEVSAVELLEGGWQVGSPLSQRVGSSSVLVLPLPFESACRITCDGEASFGVSARRYDASAQVTTFKLEDLGEHEDAITAAAERLTQVPVYARTAVYEDSMDVTGGSSIPVRPLNEGEEPKTFFPARQLEPVEYNLPEGDRAIASVTIKLFKYHKFDKRHEALTEDELVHALRFVSISFAFDEEVYSRAPLGDFMGVGTTLTEFSDLMRTVDADGTMTSRWIMPYKETGVVALHNLSQELDVWAEVSLEVIPWEWDEKSLYFMPHWTAGLETEPGERWSNVTLKTARGRLVGQSLRVMNPVSAWWGGVTQVLMMGDGDTLAPLDEADLVGIHAGTTSPFVSPLMSLPVTDWKAETGQLGHGLFNRLSALDTVEFETGFNSATTAGEDLNGLPDFASLLYFYVTKDVEVQTGYATYFDLVRSLTYPPAALELVDVIECEDVAFKLSREGLTTRERKLLPRAGGRWSGDQDLFVEANELNDAIEMTIPATGGEAKTLTLYASGGDAAGVVSIFVNGLLVVNRLDLSAPPPISRTKGIGLGTREPVDGVYVIQVQTTGMGEQSGIPIQFRPEAKRYSFGLDCITISQPQGEVK